jgi:transglutaminase-like putative cysteine protease
MQRRAWIRAAGALAGGALVPMSSSLAAQGELQLRFNFGMNNPGSIDLPVQRLWMYLPVRRNAWWTLDGIDTGLPHELQSDPLGHTILFVAIDKLGAYARRVAALTVNLKQSAVPLPAARDARDWLAPERYIESDHEAIAAQALALKSETDAGTVRNIYDFVAASMDYAGYMPEDFGALYALRQRRGDCSEYACLVVALCRASGIPARMVEGYVTDRSFAPRPMDFHDWAEVQVDGQWRVIDAQKRALLVREAQYIAFRYYRDKALNGVGLAHRYRIEGEMEFSV